MKVKIRWKPVFTRAAHERITALAALVESGFANESTLRAELTTLLRSEMQKQYGSLWEHINTKATFHDEVDNAHGRRIAAVEDNAIRSIRRLDDICTIHASMIGSAEETALTNLQAVNSQFKATNIQLTQRVSHLAEKLAALEQYVAMLTTQSLPTDPRPTPVVKKKAVKKVAPKKTAAPKGGHIFGGQETKKAAPKKAAKAKK